MSQQPFNSDSGFGTTGNITGGNILADTNIFVAAANGNLVLGDATATASPGLSSTTSVTITANRAGTAQQLVFTTAGNVYTPGNIVMAPGASLTGTGASPAPSISGFDSASFGNVVTVTGNVTAGNFITAGNVSATNFIGNGNTLSNVATRVTGSWNVTSGTNNYSFTVPINGSYQLWINGNIPNGIITYIATVSVTNSNVPVLGVQYAWNYEGAGNPILITSIPDQIIGTAGAISNAAPSVGTTTNTFEFGINNTSGGNVTVTWGYTKL